MITKLDYTFNTDASRFITTPLLLLYILLTAGLPWPTIIWVIFLDWIMIITGLVGALVRTRYKFGEHPLTHPSLLYFQPKTDIHRIL